MSIRNNLKKLEHSKELLEKDLEEFRNTINNLYNEKTSLDEKSRILGTKTSSLAKNLLEKVQKQLEELNQQIEQEEEKKSADEKKLNEINQEIWGLTDDPCLYIEEQSSNMVSAFLEYVGNNLEDIGSRIKSSYQIKEVTKFYNDRYNGCDVPTGSIGIYDKTNQCFIVSSKDFYFEREIYSLDRDEYDDSLICKKTDWYRTYYNNFISTLIKSLKKNYCLDQTLKLTIEEASSFTLELV